MKGNRRLTVIWMILEFMNFTYRTLLCALVFSVHSSTISGVGAGLVGTPAAADAFCLDFLCWYSLT